MIHRVVVTYCPADPYPAGHHQAATRADIGKTLADLKGCDFAGEFDPACRYPGPVYFVPGETLASLDEMRRLGIQTEDDLFGGVVPCPFIATKAITHPLVAPDAPAPAGWSHAFAARTRGAVLPGFTAFTLRDARVAGLRLLADGPVRIKPAWGVGWRGQVVIAGPAELDAALEAIDAAELSRCGVVLEQDLTDVTVYSVGRVCVAGLVATYFGTQHETADNTGASVYGGSDLFVVRGDYDALLGLDLPPEVRLAVTQARIYDAAASQVFPELVASRRNYDVAQGLDARGRRCSGVLEQSWRIGGASGPEVRALAAFRADPELQAVRASYIEVYGVGQLAPSGAFIHFRGTDDQIGPVTKYTLIEAVHASA